MCFPSSNADDTTGDVTTDDVNTDDTEARVVVKRELPEVPCDEENIEPLDTSRTVEKPESMNHDETNDTTSVVLGLEDIEYVEGNKSCCSVSGSEVYGSLCRMPQIS